MREPIFVVENPYGLSTLNSDGTRPNLLYRFAAHKDAQFFIDGDPEHRDYTTRRRAGEIMDRIHKGGGDPFEFPLPFMDK